MKEDHEMIRKFNKLLKSNGKIILSVPAHKKLWSSHDVWAGHYRRYDRSDLVNLIENGGFKILKILSYGYPIINLFLPIRRTLAFIRMNRIRKNTGYKIDEATKRSGFYRSIWPKIHWLYLNRFAKYFWIMIYNIQKKNYATDKGDGYLVSAKKIN